MKCKHNGCQHEIHSHCTECQADLCIQHLMGPEHMRAAKHRGIPVAGGYGISRCHEHGMPTTCRCAQCRNLPESDFRTTRLSKKSNGARTSALTLPANNISMSSTVGTEAKGSHSLGERQARGSPDCEPHSFAGRCKGQGPLCTAVCGRVRNLGDPSPGSRQTVPPNDLVLIDSDIEEMESYP